ncbi:hypothetical protein TNCV_861141 [Trichonephila clavipes]|nr:hypothetical protein TNCV_861141 [Trichonephila clavipes]
MGAYMRELVRVCVWSNQGAAYRNLLKWVCLRRWSSGSRKEHEAITPKSLGGPSVDRDQRSAHLGYKRFSGRRISVEDDEAVGQPS